MTNQKSKNNMTREEKLAYQREWYKKHREEVLAKCKKAYRKKTLKKRMAAYRRKYNAKHADELKEKWKAMWEAKNTEEFRAERRRQYAEKHKDDPMTEHRKRCIETQKKRMAMTIEERKERRIAKQAETVAKKDIRDTYQQSEEKSIRSHETVIKYIDNWSKCKTFTIADGKDGELMSKADVQAYCKEAVKYFELQKRLNETSPSDYGTRNILSYKMRVIEEHFNTLLNRKYRTKCNLKQ